MRLFQKCPDAMPCTRLAVAASDFEDGPLSEGQGSITKFFGAGTGTLDKQQYACSITCEFQEQIAFSPTQVQPVVPAADTSAPFVST